MIYINNSSTISNVSYVFGGREVYVHILTILCFIQHINNSMFHSYHTSELIIICNTLYK